uniref:hypothetical protein n=1 Tax=Microbulbifer aggregans TaxID=1769779 RepID=UPI001CFCD8A0
FVAVFLLLICSRTWSCEYSTHELFPPKNPFSSSHGSKPAAPEVIYKIQRGSPKIKTSCADLGVVSISISSQGYRNRSTGYLFEVVSSSESQEIFPKQAVQGVLSKDGKEVRFDFSWIDGASEVQEPIEVVVNVYRISSLWVLSEPTKVVIKHRGRI